MIPFLILITHQRLGRNLRRVTLGEIAPVVEQLPGLLDVLKRMIILPSLSFPEHLINAILPLGQGDEDTVDLSLLNSRRRHSFVSSSSLSSLISSDKANRQQRKRAARVITEASRLRGSRRAK
jgi:hypothetical protein